MTDFSPFAKLIEVLTQAEGFTVIGIGTAVLISGVAAIFLIIALTRRRRDSRSGSPISRPPSIGN